MKRITNLKLKLAVTFAAAAVILAMADLQMPCPFKHFFHIPCISCGMTRAWLSALNLDFAAAFSYHSMFWSVPILYLYILFDAKLFKNKFVNIAVLALIAAGFVINYIFVLIIT